jgi:hypothetical protein
MKTYGWVVSFTPRPLYPRERAPLYPLERRLSWTLWRREKSCPCRESHSGRPFHSLLLYQLHVTKFLPYPVYFCLVKAESSFDVYFGIFFFRNFLPLANFDNFSCLQATRQLYNAIHVPIDQAKIHSPMIYIYIYIPNASLAILCSPLAMIYIYCMSKPITAR